MMQKKAILYVGELAPGRTGYHRMLALRDLGHEVLGITQKQSGDMSILRSYGAKLMHRIGHPLDFAGVNRSVCDAIGRHPIDILWLDKVLVLRPSTLRYVKAKAPGVRIVAFSPDDMLNNANQSRYHLDCLPLIDAYFTTKTFNVQELEALGCNNVFFVDNGYDPYSHKPVSLTLAERIAYGAAVGFIGGYEKNRFERMLYLAKHDIPVRIRGSFWERASKKHRKLTIELGDLVDNAYARAISATDINLCFLRKVNRDLQTTRSVEIPACGAFLLAERTDEHMALFEDGKEAEFFGSNEEMLEKVSFYLANPDVRRKIAAKGRERCIKSGYSNRDRAQYMMDVLTRIHA